MAPVDGFRAVMLEAGLSPPDYIEPGRLYRFPGTGKGRGDTAGYCKLFDDCAGGIYGDHRTKLQSYWWADQSNVTAGEWRKQGPELRRAAQAARKQEQRDGAAKAATIWNRTSKAYSHQYLERKAIQAHGARLDSYNNLVVPVFICRSLASLQFIAPDGAKRFLRGGRVQGGYYPIKGDPQTVIICEGFATAATLAEETSNLVLAAFNAGNLKAVAEYARDRHPNGDIVIAADMDRNTPGNPGLTQATRAARAINARLAIPEFPPDVPGTDFNDLADWRRSNRG